MELILTTTPLLWEPLLPPQETDLAAFALLDSLPMLSPLPSLASMLPPPALLATPEVTSMHTPLSLLLSALLLEPVWPHTLTSPE